jgi:FtsZ-binding cell division protein ZapB
MKTKMANHGKFNKIVNRLYGRQFKCKTFYDYYWEIVMNGKYEVYLKPEIDEIIKELKEVYDTQEDEIAKQKKRAEDLELENYQLKKDHLIYKKLRSKKKNDNDTN